eukprot:3485602-Pyramimonas_sp.AAC.1
MTWAPRRPREAQIPLESLPAFSTTHPTVPRAPAAPPPSPGDGIPPPSPGTRSVSLSSTSQEDVLASQPDRTRIVGGNALLIDVGSKVNLVGEETAREMDLIAVNQGGNASRRRSRDTPLM